eukprot:5587713-Pyramimonas_sp.AAC.1
MASMRGGTGPVMWASWSICVRGPGVTRRTCWRSSVVTCNRFPLNTAACPTVTSRSPSAGPPYVG